MVNIFNTLLSRLVNERLQAYLQRINVQSQHEILLYQSTQTMTPCGKLSQISAATCKRLLCKFALKVRKDFISKFAAS